MRTHFVLFTILSASIRFVLSLLLDKAWVKGAKRDIPKENGVNNSLGEYLVYIVLTSVVSAVISRQLGIWMSDYMRKDNYFDENEDIKNILDF